MVKKLGYADYGLADSNNIIKRYRFLATKVRNNIHIDFFKTDTKL